MFSSYIRLALRNLAKNRLYAAINVLGLALGLTIFMSGAIIAKYEENHDHMFSQRDRIYTVGTVFNPAAKIGIKETDGVYSAFGPLMEAEVPELEAVVRTIGREFLVGQGLDSYYQTIRFADPQFTRIFDFNYIEGDASVLEDPSSMIITESAARKLFGHTRVLGETLSLDNSHNLQIAAVIEDVPADSHFNSQIIINDAKLGLIAPLAALNTITGYALEGNWNNLSTGNLTYMLVPPELDQNWLQAQVNRVYEKHTSEDIKNFAIELKTRPLQLANTLIWDAVGFPMIDTVQLLGMLVLFVACVNYTNLATAQSFGRAREVGLRKTFGASQSQLLLQFLTESLTIVLLAMLIAIASLELLLPLFNQWSGKVVELNHWQSLPFLVLTTLAVGLLAGAYPAWLITRSNPIDSLKNSVLKTRGGNRFRGFMIGIQFAISIFMLSVVSVVYMQNQKVEESSRIYDKDHTLIMERMGIDPIMERFDTLRLELLNLPGVEQVSLSSQVPFEQNNSASRITPVSGDESQAMSLSQITIDPYFLETYNIPLLAGRALDPQIALDSGTTGTSQINVLINQMGAANLGFGAGPDALGRSFYSIPDPDSTQPEVQYTIVGLLPDQNIQGLQNKIKPTMFYHWTSNMRIASVRLKAEDINETLADIDAVWAMLIPDYPLQKRFLDDIFNDVYAVFRMTNIMLAGFSAIALSLALIGLFGLAAFMSSQRTREIGIRKVLGAKISQITWLLVWQFSIPVLWSLLPALPLSYFAANLYLNFFSERISTVIPVVVLASIIGLAMAWLIVAGHAFRVASAKPVQALRYE